MHRDIIITNNHHVGVDMKAIPKIEKPRQYEAITPINSRLKRLSDCEYFNVKMQYPLMGFPHAVVECYVREEVAERLIMAAKSLPSGLRLCILDAWRPLSLQLELYDQYSRTVINKYGLEYKTDEEKTAVISRFISYPSHNVLLPPVHTTGGAVDLTLIDRTGQELNMGTEFDCFSDMSRTDYYESVGLDEKIRDNRRILYNAMIDAGFTNLPSEWWHYDFGNSFWAYYNQVPAIYKGIFSIGETDYEKE